MGIFLKAFCDAQPKNLHGHVKRMIDMEEKDKDDAIIAYLNDDRQEILAHCYPHLTDEGKNHMYSNYEYHVDLAIEKYNNGVDLDKELQGEVKLNKEERRLI